MIESVNVVGCMKYRTFGEYGMLGKGEYVVMKTCGVIMGCPLCGHKNKVGNEGDDNVAVVQWFRLTLEKPFVCEKCNYKCNIIDDNIGVVA